MPDDLVGHLDLEPVVALGEAGQRHRQAARQLVPGREVELRRQRLRVQLLRIRLVEELLAVAALLVELEVDVDVRLLRRGDRDRAP